MNKNIKKILFVLLLFTFQAYQVNSYPLASNCASLDSIGNCLECNSGYFLNNQLCYLANPYCSVSGIDGSCLSCSQGNLVNNLCLVPTSCSLFDGNGNCILCPDGFQGVGPNCYSTASLYPYCAIVNGDVCTFCFPGSYLSNGSCLVENPLCATSDANGNCLSCPNGLVLTSNYCVLSSDCASLDLITSSCLTCNTYYAVKFGQCYYLTTINPFCSVFSVVGSDCDTCLLGYYQANGLCLPASSLCLSYDLYSGDCTSCYNGFILSKGACTAAVTPANPTNSTNANNTTNNNITMNSSCRLRFYFDNNTGLCTPVDPNCNDYDLNTGDCLSCHVGSALSGTKCVYLSTIDPYCQTFNGLICILCDGGYYLGNGGFCTPANPLCLNYSQTG
jgi:hypothetical protein